MERQLFGSWGFLRTDINNIFYHFASRYHGKDMREAHKHLKLKDQDFDVIVELLLRTLQELGVQNDIIQEINGLVQTLRSETLNR